MPELPEVRVVVKALNNYVKNKEIEKIYVFRDRMIQEFEPQYFIEHFKNEKIIKVENFGKFIIFHFSNNKIMISHLRMEGKYNYFDPAQERRPHDQVLFEFKDGTNLHYNDTRMFGTFHIRTKENYLDIPPLSKLGKYAFEYDAEEFHKIIQKKKKAIKTALLDQSLIIGLGNIYVDEVLFASKIHPQRNASEITLDEAKKILSYSTSIMDKSTELGGSSIHSYTSLNKQEGQFQNFLQVHTKVNKPCPICEKPITKIKVNGRGTYLCESCQK